MPHCSRKVDDEWPLCRTCWSTLPEDLRYAVTRAYSRGMEVMTTGLSKAIAAAHAWILETFGGDANKHDPGRWERLVRWVSSRDEERKLERAAAAKTAKPATESDPEGKPVKPWRHLKLVP